MDNLGLVNGLNDGRYGQPDTVCTLRANVAVKDSFGRLFNLSLKIRHLELRAQGAG